MTATYDTIMSAALQLTPGERCRVASELWDSARAEPIETNEELEAILDQRDEELDKDPSAEITHEDFMKRFTARRRM